MKYAFLASIGCLLFSCHSALPTEEMAFQKFLSKQGDKNRNLFEFMDFKKTDGVKKNVFGAEIYEMDYHVKQLAKQDMRKCQGLGMSYFMTDSSLVADSIRQSSYKFARITRPTVIQTYKKGELIQELDGKIAFTYKESGWK